LWAGEQSMSWTARTAEVPLWQLVAVPVDVGKATAMLMACDFTGRVLLPAAEFPMTRDGVAAVLARLWAALPGDVRLVRSGWRRPGIITGRRPRRGCGRMAGRWWSSTRRT
jgi:hypothetical protein